jgi:hypothetical protein
MIIGRFIGSVLRCLAVVADKVLQTAVPPTYDARRVSMNVED